MKDTLNTLDSTALTTEVPQMPGETPLTDSERIDFENHREVIARTIEANADLIVRLIDIKQRKLYRDDYKTWENFCATILRLTAVSVNNKIRAHEIRQTLQARLSRSQMENQSLKTSCRVPLNCALPARTLQRLVAHYPKLRSTLKP